MPVVYRSRRSVWWCRRCRVSGISELSKYRHVLSRFLIRQYEVIRCGYHCRSRVGGTAGGLNFGGTTLVNSLLGQPTDYGRLAYDSSIMALSGGALTFAPGVRGALPGTFTSAIDFLSYTHAARWGAEAAVNTSMSMFGSGAYQNPNQGSRSSNAGSGGGVSQLAGAVVNYANSGASSLKRRAASRSSFARPPRPLS